MEGQYERWGTEGERRTQKRLRQRIRDRRREEVDAHDQRAHVLRRLRERVLQARDGREDLRRRDEHVRARLRPHVDRRGQVVPVRVLALARVVPARARLVDVVLQHRRPDHRHAPAREAGRHAPQRGEAEADDLEEGVDDDVADGDDDEDGEGVEVGKNVVRDTVCGERCRLRGEIVVDLVVGEPCGCM